MAAIIAIDIGTSRIKAARFAPDGTMTKLLSRRLDRAASPEIQDAEVWFTASAGLIREIAAPTAGSVDAVSLFPVPGVQAVREKDSIKDANTAQRIRLIFIITSFIF